MIEIESEDAGSVSVSIGIRQFWLEPQQTSPVSNSSPLGFSPDAVRKALGRTKQWVFGKGSDHVRSSFEANQGLTYVEAPSWINHEAEAFSTVLSEIKFAADDGVEGHYFGWPVSLDGDTP